MLIKIEENNEISKEIEFDIVDMSVPAFLHTNAENYINDSEFDIDNEVYGNEEDEDEDEDEEYNTHKRNDGPVDQQYARPRNTSVTHTITGTGTGTTTATTTTTTTTTTTSRVTTTAPTSTTSTSAPTSTLTSTMTTTANTTTSTTGSNSPDVPIAIAIATDTTTTTMTTTTTTTTTSTSTTKMNTGIDTGVDVNKNMNIPNGKSSDDEHVDENEHEHSNDNSNGTGKSKSKSKSSKNSKNSKSKNKSKVAAIGSSIGTALGTVADAGAMLFNLAMNMDHENEDVAQTIVTNHGHDVGTTFHEITALPSNNDTVLHTQDNHSKEHLRDATPTKMLSLQVSSKQNRSSEDTTRDSILNLLGDDKISQLIYQSSHTASSSSNHKLIHPHPNSQLPLSHDIIMQQQTLLPDHHSKDCCQCNIL
ncbi:hypothetical protein RFI_13046 [Reticulomyxa filosa]|uniref:Uncharacterized protein n=1 Tax=Reticulomyxa filosa TaxID=46433 RepID=X6NDZ6_RETFI|nr:hypothetical protein RFI_13046 [Reticulomyxa filosa]|eukprot:ETO24113.1 hypothetical protein RFI_13046 [Reticulomyxa filosa]